MDHRNHGDTRVLKKVLLTSGFLTFASQVFAAAWCPHRAVYDLRCEHPRSQSGQCLGSMAYEVSGSDCDGWTVSFRLVNRFDYTEGTSRLFDTQSFS